jgi:dTDP-4-dehydrorhamnose 3,5-epimerase
MSTTAKTISSALNVISTRLSGVLVLEPKTFGDARGFFLESYNERTWAEVGIRDRFVQDNHSLSARGVLRGLHYQICHPQGKLIRVAVGEIFDVAVDLRRSSPTFGQWYGTNLSGENNRQMWVPVGFAHGFSVLSESAHVLYKTTDFYTPECERTIAWNDPDLAVDWRLSGNPVVSGKDQHGTRFNDAETFG